MWNPALNPPPWYINRNITKVDSGETHLRTLVEKPVEKRRWYESEDAYLKRLLDQA